MKKNNFKSLAAVLSLAMAATAIPASADAAAAPKLTVKSTTVYSGKAYSMTVKNLKKGYTVNFSSTNGGVKFAKKKIKAKGAKISSKFTVMAAKNIADGSATKIKAVVRNAKGKKIKSVTKKVTLKQLASSITLKDIATKTVTVGTIVNADATIAPKAAKGAYAKTFTSSDSSVLKVTNASNGLFEAVAPGTATISVSAANGDQVVEGGTIQITVVEAEEQDQNPGATAPGSTGDVITPGSTGDTTGSAILTDYRLTLSANKTSITADSKDQATIDVILETPADSTVTSDMLVTAELALGTAGIGSLSQNDVTLTYNAATQRWEGQVIFTSATLKNSVTSTVRATVSRVRNADAEQKQIVGKQSNDLYITLNPENVTVDESKTVRVKQAVVESCDRILLTFDRAVEPEWFLTSTGAVADGSVNDVKNGVTLKGNDARYFQLLVKDKANEKDNPNDLYDAKVYQAWNNNQPYDYTRKIRDIQKVNGTDDTLVFILKDGCELSDNSRFTLFFRDYHTRVDYADSATSGRITDTTVPTILDVQEFDMKSIKITFDQPVVAYGYDDNGTPKFIDYLNNEIKMNEDNKDKWIKSAFNLNNYSINGTNLGSLTSTNGDYYESGDGYKSSYGYGLKIYTAVDENNKYGLNRDEIIIELGNGQEKIEGRTMDNANTQVYFRPGQYTLTVKNIGDYAALSDNANTMVSKSLNFTIAENTEVPDIRVEAQSPEQYIITFTTPIQELAGVAVGQELTSVEREDGTYQWVGHGDKNLSDTTTDDDNKGIIYLRYKDPQAKQLFDPEDRNAIRIRNLDNGAWVDATRGFNRTIWDWQRGLGQDFKLTRIEDTPEGLPRLKMEVTKDWTRLKDYSWDDKLYYNYTLGVGLAWHSVTNLANGIQNEGDIPANNVHRANAAGVTKALSGVVTSYDGTSPDIKEFNMVNDTHNSVYDIVFTEPVQGRNDCFNQYGHTITPSWDKVLGTVNGEGVDKDQNTLESLADISVRIYSKDTKKIWNAEVQGYSSLTDEMIRIKTTTLPTGNYTLYVTGVSDDVGNTSKTISYDFTVGDDSVGETFRVLSVLADAKAATPNASQLDKVNGKDGQRDALYVEFTSYPAMAPLSQTVLNPSNWTVNGVTLPVGTDIDKGIRVNTTKGEKVLPNGVTIYLEDGTLTGIDSTSVKLSASLTNNNGVALSGMTTFNTQAIFAGSRFATGADLDWNDEFGGDLTLNTDGNSIERDIEKLSTN